MENLFLITLRLSFQQFLVLLKERFSYAKACYQNKLFCVLEHPVPSYANIKQINPITGANRPEKGYHTHQTTVCIRAGSSPVLATFLQIWFSFPATTSRCTSTLFYHVYKFVVLIRWVKLCPYSCIPTCTKCKVFQHLQLPALVVLRW